MTDQSIMPFGKYAGKKLIDIPAWWWLWMLAEKKLFGPILDYANDNKEVFEAELKRDQKQ